jgi:dolichol-phosphate mannosyltransferase
MNIAVVIPTLNEAKNLRTLIPAIHCVLEEGYTTIIVDDNSQDGTQEMVEAFAELYPVDLITRPYKMGLASAVIDGIASAVADAYIVMDADFSHPPALLSKMRDDLKDYDLVVASRHVTGGGTDNWPLRRRIISRGAILLAKPLTSIKDTTTGYFGVRAHCLKDVVLTPIGYKIGLEIFVRAHWQTCLEIPFTFTDRANGTSKLGKKEITAYVRQLVQLYKYKWSR